MKYLIAYDYDIENPNPHAWRTDPMKFDTAAEAISFAESDEEDYRKQYDGEDPEYRWIVVAVAD